MREFDEKKQSKNIEKKLESNLSRDEIISKAFKYHLLFKTKRTRIIT